MPRGIPSEKLPCPKGYTKNTAKAADTGAEYATADHLSVFTLRLAEGQKIKLKDKVLD